MEDIVEITSRDNVRLKEARRVRDGKQRDTIFVEGIRLLDEAIRSELPINCLFVSREGRERATELIGRLRAREIYQLSDSAFQSICDTVTSQGLVALAVRPSASGVAIEDRLHTAPVPVVLFLYQTNNPSNLGAVIRTAEAAGVVGVIVSAGSADAFSPKALRASMGSSFRLPIWSEVEIGDALAWAAENNLRTAAAATTGSTTHTELDWTLPRLVLLGSEAHGLPEAEIGQVDDRILISMEPPVESLNLAVACGVILFEARRKNLGL